MVMLSSPIQIEFMSIWPDVLIILSNQILIHVLGRPACFLPALSDRMLFPQRNQRLVAGASLLMAALPLAPILPWMTHQLQSPDRYELAMKSACRRRFVLHWTEHPAVNLDRPRLQFLLEAWEQISVHVFRPSE
jgi:hypothetical protein